MSPINIYFEDYKPINLNISYINNRINYLINNELKEVSEISIIFCSDNYLLDINNEYLNHDYFTDIVTFDYVEGIKISGDLFISVDRIKDNANTFKSPFLKEVMRVMFHGVLHLVGYKDKSEEEQNLMRIKEEYYLSEVDFSKVEI